MSLSPIRRAACALARHAAGVMPAAHADWARAMEAEIDHIRGDADALRWALGCVWAGYRVRGAEMSGAVLVAGRVGLAALTALLAVQKLLPAVGVLAYRAGNGALLAGTVPGDTYDRVIPLIEQMPAWQLPLTFACGALYALSAIALAFGWRRAAELIALALAAQLAGGLLLRMDAAYAAIRSQAWTDAELRTDNVLLGVNILIVLAVIWLARRRPGAA